MHEALSIEVRPISAGDIPAVLALQRACFPAPFPEALLWSAEHLQVHLAQFPDGQLAALGEGRLVGSASTAILAESNWRAHRGWEETLGGHFMTCHDPAGTTLYGADISVHPDFRKQGIGKRLYAARFSLVRTMGLGRYGTGCRLPGFRDWHTRTGGFAKEYVNKVRCGELEDRVLTPMLRFGLVFEAVIENYMEDPESGDAAALLEWSP